MIAGMTLSSTFRNVAEIVTVELDTASDCLSRLDLLIRVLAGLAIEDVRADAAASARLAPHGGALALPWTPSIVDYLNAYVEDLAEEIRPDDGARRMLLDVLLLDSYTSHGARELAEMDTGEGFAGATGAMSLLRLTSLLHAGLGGRSKQPQGRFLAPAQDALREVSSRLRGIGDLAPLLVQSATRGESRIRVTIVAPGGSLADARAVMVPWSRPPVRGEVVLAGQAFPLPARISPLVVFHDDGFHMLVSTPRDPTPRYVALQPSAATESPEVDPSQLAETLLPQPVSATELDGLRRATRDAISDRLSSVATAVVGTLTESDVVEGSVLGNDYQLGRELSRGSAGAVFEARELTTGERVIVKVLLARRRAGKENAQIARDGFLREAEVLSTVRHPNLPRLLHDGTRGATPFMALEAFASTTLRDLLAPHRPLPIELVAVIASELCQALGALHERGIVHRDVKPENILVDANGHVMVIDFGLARLRVTGEVIVEDVGGTLPYTSPEAIAGTAIGTRVDIFAFGCILYECLTGLPLFPGTSRREMAEHINKERRAPAAAIPHEHAEALYDVVVACTRRESKLRLRDTDLLRSFLDQAFAGQRPTPNRRTGGVVAGLLSRIKRGR